MSPSVFKRHKKELLKHINIWIKSNRCYTVRFAIEMLMKHYLDEDFDLNYVRMISKVKSDEYYVNMMIAWYFATALAKQYDEVLPFLTNKCLDKWVHNKTIQKAIESNRISANQKTFLRTLKIK
jgi:3-methyladenine DNA glycosylase AlkD